MYQEDYADKTLISKFEDFFQTKYKQHIEHIAHHYPEKRRIEISFAELEKYDYPLAEEVLANPDVTISAAKDALDSIDLSKIGKEDINLHVGVHELPTDKLVYLKDIGSYWLGKMFYVDGVVRQVTDVLPKLKKAAWNCMSCGRIYTILQDDQRRATQPYVCECGKKNFKLNEEGSSFIDYQKIKVQEPLELTKSAEQAKYLDVMVEDDLVNRVSPGDRLKITGILRLRQPKNGGVVYERFLDAIHIEEVQKDFEELEITPEEEDKIKKLAKDPKIYDYLVQSIAPSIFGYEVIKEAIALQLFGGTKKILPDNSVKRGDIHMLLIGDPGTGKSMILQYVKKISPKSIYIAGKMASGAGLAVTAEKDDFGDGGWTLKAGALVLASGGMAAIDELDKMTDEDRSALHEAMEQQSLPYSFEMTLANGEKKKIGEIVEGLMEKYPEKIQQGKDCLILPLKPKEVELFVSDFKNIYASDAVRVSKHKPPKHFVKIKLQNGREIETTPEHPFWTVRNGKLVTVPAEQLSNRDYLPLPKIMPEATEGIKLSHSNMQGADAITKSSDFYRFLGYHISDGSYELNRGHKKGINFTNSDPVLINDYLDITKNIFKVNPYVQQTHSGQAVRLISVPTLNFLKNIDESLIEKTLDKKIPPCAFKSNNKNVAQLLKSLFDGDGHFSAHGKGGAKVGFVSPNLELIKQMQELLQRFGIQASFYEDNFGKQKVYRLTLSGYENLKAYHENIGFLSKKKQEGLKNYINNTKNTQVTLIIPNTASTVRKLYSDMKILGNKGKIIKARTALTKSTLASFLDEINGKLDISEKAIIQSEKITSFKEGIKLRKFMNLSQAALACEINASGSLISYWERNNCKNHLGKYKLALKKAILRIASHKKQVEDLKQLINAPLYWSKITNVETVKNKEEKWVYDITIEPEHTYLSNSMVLHNTISVAKAGLVGTFKSETAILAAANPKFGRFDTSELLIPQINLPPTLLSRFDLYYSIKDVLDKEKDIGTAKHILKTQRIGSMRAQLSKGISTDLNEKDVERQENEIKPIIEPDLFRKYVAYAKRNIFPLLTPEAEEEIEKFYLDLRELGRREKTVPTTARQLDAIVRLAEASARVTLSKEITQEDTKRAIRLLKTAMQDVGMDPETGKIDIDIIATGKPASQVEKMKSILGVVRELSSEFDVVPLNKVVEKAKEYNIDPDKAYEIIEKLKRSGELYSPKHGYVRVP
ncbi:MAG: hypothetical protein JXA43_01615 [Candidatus Diapherotrites archaeon]|nr:hypothetical protein [Candidatus Diapherotrites archaeon]